MKRVTLSSGSGTDFKRSFSTRAVTVVHSYAWTSADGKKFGFLLTSFYQFSLWHIRERRDKQKKTDKMPKTVSIHEKWKPLFWIRTVANKTEEISQCFYKSCAFSVKRATVTLAVATRRRSKGARMVFLLQALLSAGSRGWTVGHTQCTIYGKNLLFGQWRSFIRSERTEE